MSFWAKRYFSILALAGLFAPISATAANCAADFAGVAPHRLTRTEIEELSVICERDGERMHQLPYGADLMKNSSPEFLRAIFYQCSKIDYLGSVLNNSFNQKMKGSSIDVEVWNKIANAKLVLDGIPSKMVAAWKENSLRAFRAKFAALSGARLRGTGYQYTELMTATLNAKPFLTPEEIKMAVRLLGECLSNTVAGPDGALAGMYAPKAFQFAKQAVRRLLGLDYVPLTDLIPLRVGNVIFLKVVSVDPVVGPGIRWAEKFGLHVAPAASVQIPLDKKGNPIIAKGAALWNVGNKNYEAKYKIMAGESVKEIAPSLKTLDYEGMWADKKLTGIIFPGANMGPGETGAHAVMNNYREYFMEKGFTFTAGKPVQDIREFLKEETVSGRVDYLVKEAHAQGSDRELVKLVTSGEIVTGTKKLTGGREEIVHLFYPAAEGLRFGANPNLWLGLEFKSVGEWMKARTDAGGKQLLFMDTSCYGLTPACSLVSATNDKNLVAIGSGSQVDTFTNEPGDTVYRLLNGVRTGKSFAEIRGKGRLQLSLPRSRGWEAGIYGKMKRAASTEVDLFEDGKKIDIETMGEQY